MATKKPTILIVCTGNICRSPAAALLLAHLLGPAAEHFDIHTAGTRAVEGSPMDTVMGRLLGLRGVETTPSASCNLTVEMIESADLVLTASTGQRAAAVKLRPAAVRKTMTLKQLARYAPAILDSHEPPPAAGDRISWILAGLPQARGRAIRTESDSVADPTGKSGRHYKVALQELDRACGLIAPLLRAEFARSEPDPIVWSHREKNPVPAYHVSAVGRVARQGESILGLSSLASPELDTTRDVLPARQA